MTNNITYDALNEMYFGEKDTINLETPRVKKIKVEKNDEETSTLFGGLGRYFSRWFTADKSPAVQYDVTVPDVSNLDYNLLIQKFNNKPSKAIAEWLDGLEEDEQHIAFNWLLAESRYRLSPEALGEFLSEGNSEHFLNSYMGKLNFKNKPLYDALKQFLQYDFKLPGEAQKIDRIMSSFAKKYMSDNPDNALVHDGDAMYILCFAMIMLNTDLNNPSVSKKMTQEQFINNLRGTNDGKDFDPAFLVKIYDAMKKGSIMWEDNTYEEVIKSQVSPLVFNFKLRSLKETMKQHVESKQLIDASTQPEPEPLLNSAPPKPRQSRERRKPFVPRHLLPKQSAETTTGTNKQLPLKRKRGMG